MAINVYNQTKNFDNSVLRYIIVSLLAELRDKIYIYQHLEDGTTEKVDIPFMYSITGSERFLKDEFMYDSIDNGKAIGDYEKVPRGVINISNISIDSGSQMNKFIQAKFVHEVDGVLKTFYLRTCFLPLNMSFSCDMVCSSQLEQLKVTEAVVSKMYAVNLFYVDLGMMNVQASYQLPTDYSQERPIDFQMDGQKEYKVTFNIDVKSFMPVFEHGITYDELSEMIKGTKGTVMTLRSDEYGNVGIYPDGLLTKFHIGDGTEIDIEEIDKKTKGGGVHSEAQFDNVFPNTNIMSNQFKDMNYEIKKPGYDEPQNLNNR